jgi:cytoskeleton protein RodZ
VAPAAPVVAGSNAVPAEVKNPVAAPDGKNVLAIQAHQDSWVEIKRADNTVVASNLLKAGTVESFDLNGPVSMVIGNAGGVNVTLRGAAIDVTGNASNVARLNLK